MEKWPNLKLLSRYESTKIQSTCVVREYIDIYRIIFTHFTIFLFLISLNLCMCVCLRLSLSLRLYHLLQLSSCITFNSLAMVKGDFLEVENTNSGGGSNTICCLSSSPPSATTVFKKKSPSLRLSSKKPILTRSQVSIYVLFVLSENIRKKNTFSFTFLFLFVFCIFSIF